MNVHIGPITVRVPAITLACPIYLAAVLRRTLLKKIARWRSPIMWHVHVYLFPGRPKPVYLSSCMLLKVGIVYGVKAYTYVERNCEDGFFPQNCGTTAFALYRLLTTLRHTPMLIG